MNYFVCFVTLVALLNCQLKDSRLGREILKWIGRFTKLHPSGMIHRRIASNTILFFSETNTAFSRSLRYVFSRFCHFGTLVSHYSCRDSNIIFLLLPFTRLPLFCFINCWFLMHAYLFLVISVCALCSSRQVPALIAKSYNCFLCLQSKCPHFFLSRYF